MSKNCLFPEHKSWIDFLTNCFIVVVKNNNNNNKTKCAQVAFTCWCLYSLRWHPLIFTGLCDYRCLSKVCRWHWDHTHTPFISLHSLIHHEERRGAKNNKRSFPLKRHSPLGQGDSGGQLSFICQVFVICQKERTCSVIFSFISYRALCRSSARYQNTPGRRSVCGAGCDPTHCPPFITVRLLLMEFSGIPH